MNKSDLAEKLTGQCNLHPLEAKKVVELFFDSMTEELKNNGRIEIRGLGNLVIKEYAAYCGRNPKTGAAVQVSPKKLPFWKTGKELKDRVNGK